MTQDAMQIEVETPEILAAADKTGAVPSGVISLETIFYIALVALTLLIRFAELDTVPLTNAESAQALSAWRAIQPEASLEPNATSSPLLFALQSISFGVFGGSESAARALTVFGSALLILTPLLFRDGLGRGRALMLSFMLTISPVLFAASRFSSPVVWSLLLAVIGLWSLWRFSLDRRPSYGVGAITAFACTALLTEPGGIVLLLILGGAGLIAALTAGSSQGDYKFEADAQPKSDSGQTSIWATLRALPYASGAAMAALTVIVVSTAFLVHPDGLSSISELIGGFLRGFTTPTPNAPALFPIVVALFYEPFVWLFAIFGVIVAAQRDRMNTATRFLIGWVLMAIVASALFRGATADHALWLIVPLAALATQAVVALFSDYEKNHLWQIPTWARWVVALAMLAILAVFTLALQDAGRLIVQSPDGALSSLNNDTTSVILMLIPILFTVITFFLVASVWNDRTALQGMGIGLFIFAMISSFGSGWRIAVEGADRPNELWHTEIVTRDTFLMRETVIDIARRETGGFPELEIAALADPNGTIAWQVRDFKNARFITDISEGIGAPVVIAPTLNNDPSGDLTQTYVGQDFIIERAWSIDTVQATEFSAWWTQRRTRVAETENTRYVLWVRGDVYQGVDFDEAAG